MTEYTEQAVLVDALREYCPGYAGPIYCRNPGWVTIKAADMIEAQYRQIEELRQEIAEKDKEIEDLKREIMTYPDEEVEREERYAL